MTTVKEIGEVEKIPYGMRQIEWRIPDFFTVAEEEKYPCLASPTFFVKGVLWHLRLWPKFNSAHEFMTLYLVHKPYDKNRRNSNLAPDAHREYSVEYDFGLKKYDDSVEHFTSGTIEKNRCKNSTSEFIEKTELLEEKSELVPDNILTIVCTMKWVAEVSHNSTQPAASLDKTKPLKLIRLDKLSENFKNLFGDKESCDVTLKVKDKEYKAHKSVLVARSSVFAATFKHDTLERQTGVITISDCDPDSFQEFLEYLYSGKLEELSPHGAINLYYTSNKYDVEELKAFCIEYLMQSLTVDTMCETAIFASRYDETQLFRIVQDFFNKNFLQIFLTSEWKHLMENHCHLGSKLLEEMAKMKLEE